MKNFYAFLAFLLLASSCTKEEVFTEKNLDATDLISKQNLDGEIEEHLKTGKVYDWNDQQSIKVWSAGMHSDSIFAIGYQLRADRNFNEKIHEVNIQEQVWQDKLEELLEVVLTSEKEIDNKRTVEDLLPFGYPSLLPSLELSLVNPNTIELLKQRDDIRYVEPMGYSLDNMEVAVQRSGAGCGETASSFPSSLDYTTISPNCKQSWHQNLFNLPAAWNTAQGAGVTIAVIDTGISDDQDNLGSAFQSGNSSNRSVERYSTKYSGSWWWRSLDPPHDQCGHGTSMAGVATAPRTNNGASVGVAYKSNLIGIRAVEDVVINTSNEKKGVRDALILAGNRNDVKVISMSIGTPFSSGTVSDGIYYAYNRGKMIMAAAGTSLTWTSWYGVIFPANMSQTVAVTGIRDNSPMERCDICHSGSEVDFVVTMQRANDPSRTALTLRLAGSDAAYVSGSSAATATMAGMAALLYSDNPGSSRSQIYNALKYSSSNYPVKDNDFGWGTVDLADALNNVN